MAKEAGSACGGRGRWRRRRPGTCRLPPRGCTSDDDDEGRVTGSSEEERRVFGAIERDTVDGYCFWRGASSLLSFVLVPVRASPVPSVVRGSFVVKFFLSVLLLVSVTTTVKPPRRGWRIAQMEGRLCGLRRESTLDC